MCCSCHGKRVRSPLFVAERKEKNRDRCQSGRYGVRRFELHVPFVFALGVGANSL